MCSQDYSIETRRRNDNYPPLSRICARKSLTLSPHSVDTGPKPPDLYTSCSPYQYRHSPVVNVKLRDGITNNRLGVGISNEGIPIFTCEQHLLQHIQCDTIFPRRNVLVIETMG